MKDGQNIGEAIPNNVISHNSTTYTIKLDVYDRSGKKLIEGVLPVNSVHGLAMITITYKDP
jgi:hypothetical protein